MNSLKLSGEVSVVTSSVSKLISMPPILVISAIVCPSLAKVAPLAAIALLMFDPLFVVVN